MVQSVTRHFQNWRKRWVWGLLVLCFAGACSDQSGKKEAPVRVVATLNPLHSLAQSIMEGRGSPEILLEARDSPHTAILKPSQKRKLHEADLVVWVGGFFETFLQKEMASLPPQRLLTIVDIPQMILHTQGAPSCQAQNCPHLSNTMDGHLWMDPENGILIGRALAERLSTLDPKGKALYTRNFQKLEKKLRRLDQELRGMLAPCKSLEFFVVHQAYGYFTRRYGLQTPRALILNHERLLTPQSLLDLSAFLKKHPRGWVFFEPQFLTVYEKIADFVKKRGGRIGKMDPLGVGQDYCGLLTGCARSILECLP
jgi:zinc transport system substrate-binding protein